MIKYIVPLLLCTGCLERKIDNYAFYCKDFYKTIDGMAGVNCKRIIQGEYLYKQENISHIFINYPKD
jgi:hypothetical protein